MKEKEKKKAFNPFRCNICGRFIGFKEFEKQDVRIDFVPDTYVSIEKSLFYHEKCIQE